MKDRNWACNRSLYKILCVELDILATLFSTVVYYSLLYIRPDPDLIWGRGHVCVVPQEDNGAQWLPERLVRVADNTQGNVPLSDAAGNVQMG